MPPKKKTTSAKATTKTAATKKKATTSVKKKTSTAKKTAPKKITTKKAAPKKVSTAKKTVAKKTTTKSSKPKKAVSYMDWENVVKACFKAFPKLWWRVGIVNSTTVILMFLAFAVAGGITVLGFGGVDNVENFVANMKFGLGFDPSSFMAIGLGLFVFFNLMLIIGMLGKIANFLTVKNYVNNDKNNPFIVYFKDTWAYFWRYIILGFRVFWYIVWPTLVFMVVLSGVGLVSDSFDLPLEFMIPLAIAAIVFMVFYTIYRSVQMFFYQGVLICSDASSKESFDKALSLVKNNWWSVFFSVFIFFVLMGVVQSVFVIPEILVEFYAVPAALLLITSLLDFIFSFFILAPVTVAFMYFLMLQVAKNKNIKL